MKKTNELIGRECQIMGGENNTHNWSLKLGPLTKILIPTPKTRPWVRSYFLILRLWFLGLWSRFGFGLGFFWGLKFQLLKLK
jgi:hypothetical protein